MPFPPTEFTLSSLIDAVAYDLHGSGATASTQDRTNIQGALHDSVQEVMTEHLYGFTLSHFTINTVAGTDVYSLPSDLFQVVDERIRRVVDSYEYPLIHYTRARRFGSVEETGNPVMWSIDGASASTGRLLLKLAPVPDGVHVITGDYHSLAEDILEASESDVVDPRYPRNLRRLLIVLAELKFPQYLTPQQMQSHQVEKMDLTRKLRKTVRRVSGAVDQMEHYQPNITLDRYYSLGHGEASITAPTELD